MKRNVINFHQNCDTLLWVGSIPRKEKPTSEKQLIMTHVDVPF